MIVIKIAADREWNIVNMMHKSKGFYDASIL